MQEPLDRRCGVAPQSSTRIIGSSHKAFPSFHSSAIMQEQQKRWKELCELAAQEQNPKRLMTGTKNEDPRS
jgi:hypothetical protein